MDLIGVILMDQQKKLPPPQKKHQILVVFGPNHDTQKSTKTYDAISIAHSD